jgi:hypothetical protein
VFENRVLRRIFVPKRDEETEGWTKLQNDLYSSSSKIKMITSKRVRLAGPVAQMGEKRNAYGKARGKETSRKTKT